MVLLHHIEGTPIWVRASAIEQVFENDGATFVQMSSGVGLRVTDPVNEVRELAENGG